MQSNLMLSFAGISYLGPLVATPFIYSNNWAFTLTA